MTKELENHPKIGEGDPEELKYQLKGLWSRRINKRDRLIYQINDTEITVTVIAALNYYSDK
ncbi:Txe/YoeB family addiction module toxin [Myroides sp. N17-2]|uniref:Txe/YoeB family addiction module toxin n=1 Tax=Myroides sp. N17-2 TaxID=2030799 RepID=UPI000EFC8D10